MKGRILAGVLSVSLLLTGCASMLTREYGSVEPHSATLVSEGDANTLRAESYQEVVNGLIYFINRGAESGSIRFDGEEPDVRALLDEACLEAVSYTHLDVYKRQASIRSDFIRTMSALSMATSVPAPMARPTSARARAGASLTPSPTMATFRPSSWS